LVVGAASIYAAQRYPVTGQVLKIDPAHREFVASCKAIPGYMDAMVMPIPARDDRIIRCLVATFSVRWIDRLSSDDPMPAAGAGRAEQPKSRIMLRLVLND
jgi:hypothetical protein